MGKILYFDCFSGASGDMILGACLDAGLPLDELRRALGGLAVDGFEIRAERVLRQGVAATKFRLDEHATPASRQVAVAPPHEGHDHDHAETLEPAHDHEPQEGGPYDHELPDAEPREHKHHNHDHHDRDDRDDVSDRGARGRREAGGHDHHHHDHAHDHPHHGPHRTVQEIDSLIERSSLSAEANARARRLFRRLAETEAAIHQMPVDRVHLHEVGALDSVIDIVGAVFALEWIGASRIISSPLNVGSGTVRAVHGVLPVPAPATARLLAGAAVYSSGVDAELVTPTGALLITDYASSYGPMPRMTIRQTGYGAGDRDLHGTPNVLRVFIGEDEAQAAAPGLDRVLLLECEIDDMNPQIFGVLMDRLYGAGALDVLYAPIQMKKNRPGTLVTIVANTSDHERLSTIVFRETTTLGLRSQIVERERLERETIWVQTPVGAVRIKVARRGGAVFNASPEFDDCVRLSAERGLSVKDVQALASKAYLEARYE